MRRRWRALLVILALAVSGTGAGRGASAAEPARYFPETGFSVQARFLAYWEGHGGLAQQGFPISGEFEEINPTNGRPYTVQYFERARFEWHPELAGTPYEVLLGLIGREQLASLYPQGTPADTGPADTCFPATGRCIRDEFYEYWLRHGGLAQYGYPLSGEFAEVNPTNGLTYRVQYFERARFEYHPELAGTPYAILLGLLGREQFLAQYPAGRGIGIPAPGQRVTLPLHLLARVGRPGERVTATLRWQDGTRRAQSFTLLRGEDGAGLLIGNLEWDDFYDVGRPAHPGTQAAMLELRGADNRLYGERQVVVLGPDDPDLQVVSVYWTISGTELVGPQPRRIVRTPQVGAAALNELLWGPPSISNVGYRTALPTPEQVLAYPGREPDWGPRVTLRALTIANGVATADFSRELRAYGGGSLRVKQIADQIGQTLRQFPTVREVRVTIEGRDDLQP